MAAGGRGVGQVDGRVWFVRGGLPGDRVLARPERDAERFVEAVAEQLLESAPDRRLPTCSVQERCGGCPWMPLAEARQRELKRQLVIDALQRLAHVEIEVPEVRTAGESLHYRNRIEVHWDGESLGYFEAGSKRLVDLKEGCPLAMSGADAILTDLRARLAGLPAPDRPQRFHLRGNAVGQWLLGWPSALAVDVEQAERWVDDSEPLAGIVRLVWPKRGRGGLIAHPVAGAQRLAERFAGIDYELPAATFLQVNVPVAEAMTARLVEWARDPAPKLVWDLFSGVGAHGLALLAADAAGDEAEGAVDLTLVDADAAAMRCGRRAAKRAGRRARFVHARVEDFLKRADVVPDLAIVNPPRTGLQKSAAEALVRHGPPRLLFVACDPATLARDISRLAKGSYRPTRLEPWDMFPQTAHVETLVELRR